MEKNEIYDFIGDLAIVLYLKKIQITLSSLNSILKDKGAEYGNNRDLGAGVVAAWSHWKEKDPVIYHAIAYTFIEKNGNIPWA